MRKWKVGTLSAGILMIVLGAGMLAAQFKQANILEMLFTCWPAILVLVGAEILLQVYIAKGQQPVIKYDLSSIFIILIVVILSMGMYALTLTGIIKRVVWMVESNVVALEIPPQRISVDETLEKIVISAPKSRLDIKNSGISEVVVFGETAVKIADSEEAKALVEQNQAIFQRVGNTLFVQFLSPAQPGDFSPGVREISHTLLLPADVEVDVGGPGYFNLGIDGRAFAGNWFIKGRGSVNITAARPLNLAIDVQIKNGGNLKGNANWEAKEMSESHGTIGPGNEGYMKWGEGTNKVNIILDSGEVEVDEV